MIEGETKAERLRSARLKAGFTTAAAAAREFDIPEPTYAAHENGSRGFDEDVALRYAQRFGVDPMELIFGIPRNGWGRVRSGGAGDASNSGPRIIRVSTRGRYVAGLWLELGDLQQPNEAVMTIDIASDGRLNAEALYALPVETNDAGTVVRKGQILICHDLSIEPLELRSGQYVIVEETSGNFIKLTMMKVERSRNGLVLYSLSPSSEMEWVAEVDHDGVGEEHRIVAKVQQITWQAP